MIKLSKAVKLSDLVHLFNQCTHIKTIKCCNIKPSRTFSMLIYCQFSWYVTVIWKLFGNAVHVLLGGHFDDPFRVHLHLSFYKSHWLILRIVFLNKTSIIDIKMSSLNCLYICPNLAAIPACSDHLAKEI